MPQVPNQIYSVKVTTDLTAEPVTLLEVKSYGNITYADYDTLLGLLITTARKQLERYSGRSFGVKTIQCDLSHNGCKPVRLPQGEVNAITALYFKPCHAQPYTDRVAEVLDRRSDQTGDQLAFTIEGGDRFSGLQGYYMLTYTTTAYWATEDVKTAIKAQTIHLFNNRDNDQLSAQIDPIAKGLIQSVMPGDLMI